MPPKPKRVHPITEANDQIVKAIYLGPIGCVFVVMFWGLIFELLGWMGCVTVH